MLGRSGSPGLLPNDHARTLVELLRASQGGGIDLARRWVAALMLVPEREREAVVSAIESRIVQQYAAAPRSERSDEPGPPVVHLRSQAVQRDGFVEETVRSYQPASGAPVGQTGSVEGAARARRGGRAERRGEHERAAS